MWVIRYDTKAEFDVDSKAEYQLNSTGIRKNGKEETTCKNKQMPVPL